MDVHSAPHTGRVQEKSHLYYICGEYRFSPSFLFFYLSFETRITVITVSKGGYLKNGVTRTEMSKLFWFLQHESRECSVIFLKWHCWGNATAQKLGKYFPCAHQLLAVDKYTT